MVREEFIRHAESNMQVQPPSESSPSPPPSPRQPPQAELVGCVTVTQSRDEVKPGAAPGPLLKALLSSPSKYLRCFTYSD